LSAASFANKGGRIVNTLRGWSKQVLLNGQGVGCTLRQTALTQYSLLAAKGAEIVWLYEAVLFLYIMTDRILLRYTPMIIVKGKITFPITALLL